jgi:uncharacterized protein (TIGR00730 family)
MKRISVFCGSSAGHRPEYAEAARATGETIARRGLGLVFGGGQVGLMGIAADACLAAGGDVIGVIPRGLARKELAHAGLKDLRVVETMHDRKALMAELSDAFVALPGGFGTLEEFFEVLTWAQLGIHLKPCALLNVAGFFDPLLKLIEHSVDEGFVHPDHRRLLLHAPAAEALLDAIAAYKPPLIKRWIEPEKT